MKNKEDAPSFWKRNKDKIIVGFVCSLFSVLLMLTGQKIFKNF
ncbi:MAG: hypothetical protein SVS15_01260 [Thermodesulfobacteriota bacterium]|nr:hypothetical protein [Thermodesulfobacteriota bacterium]